MNIATKPHPHACSHGGSIFSVNSSNSMHFVDYCVYYDEVQSMTGHVDDIAESNVTYPDDDTDEILYAYARYIADMCRSGSLTGAYRIYLHGLYYDLRLNTIIRLINSIILHINLLSKVEYIVLIEDRKHYLLTLDKTPGINARTMPLSRGVSVDESMVNVLIAGPKAYKFGKLPIPIDGIWLRLCAPVTLASWNKIVFQESTVYQHRLLMPISVGSNIDHLWLCRFPTGAMTIESALPVLIDRAKVQFYLRRVLAARPTRFMCTSCYRFHIMCRIPGCTVGLKL